MNNQNTEEINETVRSILSQATVYIDDTSIHLTSNPPNYMVDLRMTLARRGLDLLGELPELRQEVEHSSNLQRRKGVLEDRYQELEEKIARARVNLGGKTATITTSEGPSTIEEELTDNGGPEDETEEGI